MAVITCQHTRASEGCWIGDQIPEYIEYDKIKDYSSN